MTRETSEQSLSSQRIVEFMQIWTEAFNARDIEAMIAYCDPSFEFDTPLAVYHGHDGLRRWQQDFDEAWGDEIRGEPEAFVHLGDRTLGCYVLRARGRQSGMEVAMQNAAIMTWRDGLVVRLKVYLRLQDALSELGVSKDALEPIDP